MSHLELGALSGLALRRLPLRAGRGPAVTFHIDAALGHGDAFGFEQAALQGGVRFANQEPAPGPDDAVPRDAESGRAGGHGMTGGTRTSAQAERPGDFAVRGDATAWDFFHEFVDRVPGHGASAHIVYWYHVQINVGSILHPRELYGNFFGVIGIAGSASEAALKKNWGHSRGGICHLNDYDSFFCGIRSKLLKKAAIRPLFAPYPVLKLPS